MHPSLVWARVPLTGIYRCEVRSLLMALQIA